MRIDPRARVVTNSSGNAVVYDRDAFDWGGDTFGCPPHDELVIYETHIGSFKSPPRVTSVTSVAWRASSATSPSSASTPSS